MPQKRSRNVLRDFFLLPETLPMQSNDGLLKLVDRGTKRKFFTVRGDILAKRSCWHSRKPTNLMVEKGFLPSDSSYSVQEVWKGSRDVDFISAKNRKFILKDQKRSSSPSRYFVIEKNCITKDSSSFFSKFHSVVQVMLATFYEPYRLVAKPLAIAATDRISNRYDMIFEMTEREFIDEYRTLKSTFDCAIPAVEEGLLLEDRTGAPCNVQGNDLLRCLHRCVQNNITRICPTQKPLLTIQEHFSHVANFSLHFDSLYLLTNAELYARECEGEPVEQYAKSAFDLLYDVWVCCYLHGTRKYKLLHLSGKAWDDHMKGMPLILTEYSSDVKDDAQKEVLNFQAVRAANHYDFMGLNFIIPESSIFYQNFRRSCINA